MTRGRLAAVCAAMGVLVLGGSAVPVFAADNGTVDAQVIASSGACIIVTPATNVDFGTASFQSRSVQNVTSGNPSIDVTSCASTGQTILGRGTNATGTNATWTLTTSPVCDGIGATNLYNLGLRNTLVTPAVDQYLSTTDASLGSIAASERLSRAPIMRMPCTGSSGAGQTMSMSYVFTATIP